MNEQTRETLLILQEECAEVIQAASKVIRFGEKSTWPTEDSATTLEGLELEVGQVLTMIDILVERGYLSDTNINAARQYKREKLKIWSNIFKDK